MGKLISRQIVLILMLFPILAQGQDVPGYLGKRHVLSYDFSFFPTKQTIGENLITEEGWTMNFKSGVSLDYICSKRIALTVGMDYLETYIQGKTWYHFQTVDGFFSIKGFRNPKISSLGWTAGLKAYFDHIAPLGSNFELKFLYRKSSFTDFGIVDTSTFNNTELSVEQYGISLGFGVTRAVTNHFLISYGMYFNLILPPKELLNIEKNSKFYLYYNLENNIRERVQLKDLVHFKMAIAYIF